MVNTLYMYQRYYYLHQKSELIQMKHLELHQFVKLGTSMVNLNGLSLPQFIESNPFLTLSPLNVSLVSSHLVIHLSQSVKTFQLSSLF